MASSKTVSKGAHADLLAVRLFGQHDQETGLLGHTNRFVPTAHGDEFGVRRFAHRFEHRTQVDPVEIMVVEDDSTVAELVGLDRGQDRLDHTQGQVDADGLLITVVLLHPDVKPPAVELARRGGRRGQNEQDDDRK